MKHFYKSIALAVLACAASLPFAGCGGGDGDGGPQPTASGPAPAASSPQPSPVRFAAAGFWHGPFMWESVEPTRDIQDDFWDIPSTNGSYAALVVLPTGETWILYNSGSGIDGPGHGQTQITGTSVSTSITSFGRKDVTSDNYLGSVIAKSKFALTVTPPAYGFANNLLMTYDDRYDQTASLSRLAGTYTNSSGPFLIFGSGSGTYYRLPTLSTATSYTAAAADSGASVPASPPTAAFSQLNNNYAITISSTGAVTLPPDSVGCSGSGAATPRTDSNVFNLSLQFSGAKCVLGDGAKVNGIAVVENSHLLMMAVPPGSPPAGEFVFVSQ